MRPQVVFRHGATVHKATEPISVHMAAEKVAEAVGQCFLDLGEFRLRKLGDVFSVGE
jgi:hypothetical protein